MPHDHAARSVRSASCAVTCRMGEGWLMPTDSSGPSRLAFAAACRTRSRSGKTRARVSVERH
eukprot:82045-Rhodomonas_salina.2